MPSTTSDSGEEFYEVTMWFAATSQTDVDKANAIVRDAANELGGNYLIRKMGLRALEEVRVLVHADHDETPVPERPDEPKVADS